MRLRTLACLILAGTCARIVVEAQSPRVTSVSGTPVHGEVVAIRGSGFGTKPTAAPVKFDDFQSVPLSKPIASVNSGGPAWRTSGTFVPIASASLLRTGTPFTRNMQSRWRPSGGREPDVSNVYLTGLTIRQGYLDFWYYMDATDARNFRSPNIKIFRLHQDGAGAPNANWSTSARPGVRDDDSFCHAGDGKAQPEGGACAPSEVAQNGSLASNAFSGSDFYNKWNHFQIVFAAGTGTLANGTWIVYINGKLRYNRPGNISEMNGQLDRWTELYVGNYVRSGDDYTGELRAHIDSLYFDTSWARVEIGNHPSYGRATHREIEVPVAWNQDVVTVRWNRGSFAPNERVFVYVCTAANICSNGLPVGPAGRTGRGGRD